ncbi:hypothetical protein KKA09_03185 [Patescibacteria group bacterium]|nr:hypothetical protein [Patescibacteria group bacterium]
MDWHPLWPLARDAHSLLGMKSLANEDAKNSERIDGRHPIAEGKNIYFINKYDNQLYKLTLPEPTPIE